jgi:hypothetical protein
MNSTAKNAKIAKEIVRRLVLLGALGILCGWKLFERLSR